MTTRNKLQIAILRSEEAYKYYSNNGQYFFQAQRIYFSNKIIYDLLNDFIFEDNASHKEICEYIFHLDDWFEQYEENKKRIDTLNSKFIFKSWDSSIKYPKNFIDNL